MVPYTIEYMIPQNTYGSNVPYNTIGFNCTYDSVWEFYFIQCLVFFS